eukprot:gene144-12590_t
MYHGEVRLQRPKLSPKPKKKPKNPKPVSLVMVDKISGVQRLTATKIMLKSQFTSIP